jgi:hypothetical protein
MKYNLDKLKEISNLHPSSSRSLAGIYRLAEMADCSCDNDAAAEFLISIADTVIEQTDDIDAEDWQRVALDNGDILHEIADNSPSDYTHARWEQFIGTAAWREDLSEYGAPSDMTQAAAVALTQIAHRLALAIAEAISAEITEDAEVMA